MKSKILGTKNITTNTNPFFSLKLITNPQRL